MEKEVGWMVEGEVGWLVEGEVGDGGGRGGLDGGG